MEPGESPVGFLWARQAAFLRVFEPSTLFSGGAAKGWEGKTVRILGMRSYKASKKHSTDFWGRGQESTPFE